MIMEGRCFRCATEGSKGAGIPDTDFVLYVSSKQTDRSETFSDFFQAIPRNVAAAAAACLVPLRNITPKNRFSQRNLLFR